MECEACPRKCRVDRTVRKGFCGVKGLNVAKVGLHAWEEPCISGRHGSGTIFFTGCNLHCLFCQNEAISRTDCGRDITVDQLGQLMLFQQQRGAENINLVSPSHFIEPVTEALRKYKPQLHIPVVYNSNGYESVGHLRLLEGLVDVYLPDLKYADNALAKSYSAVDHYFETATACIAEMARQVGRNRFDRKSGILQKGLIVRHLVLPGQLGNSFGVLDYIAKWNPETWISLMAQYFPTAQVSRHPQLGRRLTADEYDTVCAYMIGLGLENGYCQDLDSNSVAYVPDFGLKELDDVLAQIAGNPLP